MIKNECDIVKDLLPNYIEGILSDNSKEFVDKHIKTCKYCKETLDMLKNGEKIEEARKQAEDMAEIDYLKQYNKKINILKTIATMLLGFIIIMWGVLIVRYVQNKRDYAEGEYIYNIMNTACNTMKNYNQNNNYIFTREEITNGKITETLQVYRKGDLYKEVRKFHDKYKEFKNLKVEDYETYAIKTEDMIMTMTTYDNGEDYTSGGYLNNDTYTYNNFAYFPEIAPLREYFENYKIVDFSNLEIREEEHQGKEYYVINNTINHEFWIEKDKMIVTYEKYTSEDCIIENKYSIEDNVVKDSDVIAPEPAPIDSKYYYIGADLYREKYKPMLDTIQGK